MDVIWHTPSLHTPTSPSRGREGRALREGGGRTHYGDGGGDWMSCPIFSAFFPPPQHIHACVCAYVCTRLYRTCTSTMWPAMASILLFYKSRKRSREHYWCKVEQIEQQTNLFWLPLRKGFPTICPKGCYPIISWTFSILKEKTLLCSLYSYECYTAP